MQKLILYSALLISFFGYGQKQLDVFFDFNKDFPNQKSILAINEWIVKNKNVEIVKMLGYCDSIDTEDYNKGLAERRIDNVLDLLKISGVKIGGDIEKVAYGKNFKQSKIQAENRKVTVLYNEEGKIVKSELGAKIKMSKPGETIQLPDIYFFNNSARIVPKSVPILVELLCAMEDNPKLKIEIQGHICCQPVFDLSNLSVSRARAVYMYLIRNKINKERMTYKGYGTSRPIHPIPEKNAQEEDENRRVEILILEN